MRVVGQHFQHFAFLQTLLHAAPERGRQNLPVHPHEGGPLRSQLKARKLMKVSGKTSFSRDVEPGLAAHFVFVVGRLRQVAEAAVRHLAQLVVVVEDHAAVARDAEVLQQQVAREDVGVGEVADALSVVERGAFRCGLGCACAGTG